MKKRAIGAAAVLLPLSGLMATYFLAPRRIYDGVIGLSRKRARLRRKSVEVDGESWPYLEGGPAGGDTILLVHGFGGEKDNWVFYAPYLTGQYRVIIPDLPGFGENMRILGRDYSMAKQAERLRDFLDRLGVEHCHYAGNSMGGFIGLHAALLYPQRLRSLTLLNNAGVKGDVRSELEHLLDEGQNPLRIQDQDDIEAMLAFISHRPVRLPARLRKVMHKHALQHPELMDEIFEQTKQDSLEFPLTDRLGEIETPTLIIWGQHDRVIDVSCVPVLESGIRGSEAVVFDDVGHVPMIEAPKRTAKVHRAFMARH